MTRLLVSLRGCWKITGLLCYLSFGCQMRWIYFVQSRHKTHSFHHNKASAPRAQLLFTVKCLLETWETLGLCAQHWVSAEWLRTARVRGSRARYSQPRPVLLPAVSRTQFLSLISLKRNHRHYPNENLTFNNTTLFIRALFWLHYCAVLKHELCIMIGVSLQLAPVLCRVPLSPAQVRPLALVATHGVSLLANVFCIGDFPWPLPPPRPILHHAAARTIPALPGLHTYPDHDCGL